MALATDRDRHVLLAAHGLVVGVSGPRGVIHPLALRWPDASGRFSMVLPPSARGTTLRFWENPVQLFSPVAARPGGPVNLRVWPKVLGQTVPRGLARLSVPTLTG